MCMHDFFAVIMYSDAEEPPPLKTVDLIRGQANAQCREQKDAALRIIHSGKKTISSGYAQSMFELLREDERPQDESSRSEAVIAHILGSSGSLSVGSYRAAHHHIQSSSGISGSRTTEYEGQTDRILAHSQAFDLLGHATITEQVPQGSLRGEEPNVSWNLLNVHREEMREAERPDSMVSAIPVATFIRPDVSITSSAARLGPSDREANESTVTEKVSTGGALQGLANFLGFGGDSSEKSAGVVDGMVKENALEGSAIASRATVDQAPSDSGSTRAPPQPPYSDPGTRRRKPLGFACSHGLSKDRMCWLCEADLRGWKYKTETLVNLKQALRDRTSASQQRASAFWERAGLPNEDTSSGLK